MLQKSNTCTDGLSVRSLMHWKKKKKEKNYLNPIRRAYSPCSCIVRQSVPVQFAELVLARNRLVRDLKISSILNGRTAPKISSGFMVLCISRACRNSGDWAHSGGLKVRTRSSSSESEYSLLISGSSMSSLGTACLITVCLGAFCLGASIWTLTRAAVCDWRTLVGSSYHTYGKDS